MRSDLIRRWTHSWHLRLWLFRASVLATVVVPATASAATFSDMFLNLEQQMRGFGAFLYGLSLVAGLVLFVLGLIKFKNVHYSKEPKWVPVVLLLVGISLMSLPFVISTVTTSTFGENTSQVSSYLP